MPSRHFACLFAILLTATVAAAEENTSTGPHILHAKLKPAVWAAKYVTFEGPDRRMKVGQRVPETLVFNAKGQQVTTRFGYDGRAASWLPSILKSEPPAGAASLKDFAQGLTSPEGAAFPPVLPPGEPVVVVFGAAWCAPCRALKADLVKIPDITILDVDVNQADMDWKQIMTAVQNQAAH